MLEIVIFDLVFSVDLVDLILFVGLIFLNYNFEFVGEVYWWGDY